MSKKLLQSSIKNASYVFIGNIITIILQLFIAGYNIRVLGESIAGFYFLVQTLTGIGTGILNFGFGVAAIREIAVSKAKQDSEKIKKIVGSIWSLNSILAIVYVVLLFQFRSFIVGWSKLSPAINSDAEISIIFFGMAFFLSLSFNIFEVLPAAYQQYQYQSIFVVLSSILGSLGNYLILTYIPSLTNLALVQFCVIILNCIIIFFISYKITHIIFFPNFKLSIIRKLFSFSTRVFLTQQGYHARDYIDRWVLNTLQGSIALPGYILGQRLYMRIQSLFSGIVHFLFPMMSDLTVNDSDEKKYKIYDAVEWLLSMSGIVIFSVLIILSKDILSIWVNSNFATKYYFIFQIAFLQGAISMFCIAPYFISYGLNKPNMNMYIAFIQGAFVGISAFLIIPKYGITGAAVTQASAFFLVWGFQNVYFTKVFHDITFVEIIKPQVTPSILFIFMLIVTIYYNHIEFNFKGFNEHILFSFIFIIIELVITWLIEIRLMKKEYRKRFLKDIFSHLVLIIKMRLKVANA